MRGSVLVVENESVIGRLVTHILGEEGFRVAWLADPQHAAVRDEVARFQPDVVLLDGGNAAGYGESWQNAAWLHNRARPIAVIMFTAHARDLAEAKLGLSERSKNAAFAGFVAKPFDLEELIDLVASAAEPLTSSTLSASH